MYITVRTTYNYGEIDTAVKSYHNYDVARTNLIMQRDILMLELLIKYTGGNTSIADLNEGLDKYGTFTFSNDVLEFIDNDGNYQVRYEIKVPENHRENDYSSFKKAYNTDWL